MSDFENAVKAAAEKAVLKIISEGSWVQPDYANRVQLPKEFMADVWKMVDTEKIKNALAARLESELADRLVNHIAAEIATDVKQLLSVTERREALRSIARQHMDAVLSLGGKN
jgi:Mg/Co/Ni transporter MgtE